MPASERAFINRLLYRLVGLAVTVVLLAFTVVALVLALRSSQQSNDVANCVNQTQADRAYANNLIREAQLADTRAELAHERGQISLRALLDSKTRFEAAQRTAKAYSDAHPAGRC